MEFSKPEDIDGKHYYINPKEVFKLTNIKDKNFPISLESLNFIINCAIRQYNTDVQSLIDGNKTYLMGNTLGRPIEYLLSKFIHLNDAQFKFKQGNEGNEPDLTNISVYECSIEVKTSKTLIKDPNKCRPIITGNSSYAKDKQDETSKKTKNRYYILINYKLENNKIIDYKAWFGFILQSDWLIPNKGAASKLDVNNPEVQKRIVEIV